MASSSLKPHLFLAPSDRYDRRLKTAFLRGAAGALISLLMASAGFANSDDTPLSGIDWLSDSLSAPVALPHVTEPPISSGALPDDVAVRALDVALPDAVGLLPTSVTGLPRDIWGTSTSADLARRINGLSGDLLPAARALLVMLLLAELDPPNDSTAASPLFLARIDTLLSLGALDEAEALLERAGPNTPALFQRWFDSQLLLGTEDNACESLRAAPHLSPTFPARIFCLARTNDWRDAIVTLTSAQALDMLSPQDNALLERFLYPDEFEGEPPLVPPLRPTPLAFRILEAIGEPLASTTLPLAFAQTDLRPNIGWKSQIEAAERLARYGAIAPSRLLGIYTERRAAASGGVWDRVSAFQAFDNAMTAKDPVKIAQTLPAAWRAMEQVGLENTFARLFGRALADIPLAASASDLAFRIGLLSPEYETVAALFIPTTQQQVFLIALARGDGAGLNGAATFHADLPDAQTVSAAKHLPKTQKLAQQTSLYLDGDLNGLRLAPNMSAAIANGFTALKPPVRLQSLLAEKRMGEAILRGLALLTSGAQGDLDEITDSLALLRFLGLEDSARRAALELLLLDRRG